MISVLTELLFGVVLFVAAIYLIPKLLSGDRKVYEIAVPFGTVLIISILLISNFNLSLIIATFATAVFYLVRKKRR